MLIADIVELCNMDYEKRILRPHQMIMAGKAKIMMYRKHIELSMHLFSETKQMDKFLKVDCWSA